MGGSFFLTLRGPIVYWLKVEARVCLNSPAPNVGVFGIAIALQKPQVAKPVIERQSLEAIIRAVFREQVPFFCKDE